MAVFTDYRLCSHPSKKYNGERFFALYMNVHPMKGVSIRVQFTWVGKLKKGRSWRATYPKDVHVSDQLRKLIRNAAEPYMVEYETFKRTQKNLKKAA